MKQNKKARNRYAYENHEHDVPPAPSGYVRRSQQWEGDGSQLRSDYTNVYPNLARYGGQQYSIRNIKTVDATPREKMHAKRCAAGYNSRWGRWELGYLNGGSVRTDITNGISYRFVYGIKNLAAFEYIDHQFYSTLLNNTYLEQGADGFKFYYGQGDSSFTVQLWRDRAVYESHQFSVPLVDDHVYSIEAWGKGTNWKFRLYSPSLGQSDTKESSNVADMRYFNQRSIWDTDKTVSRTDPEAWPELWLSHAEQVTHPLGG